jgi:hypothetical protein
MLRSTIMPGGYLARTVAPPVKAPTLEEVRANGRLPYWAWMLPATTAVASVLAWTVWGGTERGTWIGGILIGLSAVLVYALALEALPHERGPIAALQRGVFAAFLGLAAGATTFLAAGLGYYLEFRPFG